MRILPTAAAIAIAVLSAIPFAKAEPLAPASVPATAKWVVHIDMDAARDTTLWKFLQEKFMASHPGADNQINAVETMTGMKFPDDLHDVTLYGPSFEKGDAAILIHAAVNQDKITDLLKLNPDFASTAHNDHDILTWRDNGQDRLLYGCFYAQDRIIMAPTEKLVADALDALDKKIEVLKADSPLAGGIPVKKADQPADQPKTPMPVVYVAGLNLADLQKTQNPLSPVIAQADAGWLAVTEVDKKIVAKAAITAKTEKAADKMITLANGLKAMLSLVAGDENADVKARTANAALDGLTLKRSAATVTAELPISLDTLQNIMDAMQNGRAKKNPATPAPTPAQ